MDLFQSQNAITYVDLILPVPVPNLFTYHIEDGTFDKLKIGLRVVVELGANRIITGVIANFHKNEPAYATKPLLDVLDEEPLITKSQIKLFHWISDYYLANIGDVFLVAFPSGLKVTSDSIVQIKTDSNPLESEIPFTPTEKISLELIQKEGHLSYDKLKKALNKKNIYHLLRSLQKKEAILIFEKLSEKYKPKTINKIRLNSIYTEDETLLQKLFEKLEKKAPQVKALLCFLKLSKGKSEGVLRKQLLEEGASEYSIKALQKSEVFTLESEVISRLEELQKEEDSVIHLNEIQEKVKNNIFNQFLEKDIVLLHGITGSGKTEIYIETIKEALNNGSQVLYLLPEIALSTQIIQRLKTHFGDVMGVYHSKYSANERAETWMALMDNKIQLIVGVRSSVFLPFQNLGLIVIDECHETSYKQQAPSPRYHAVDTALVLAKQQGAKVLMGSATPTTEQLYHAHQGNYGLESITKRYGNSTLPDIELVNTKLEKKKKKMKGPFSVDLLDALKESLDKKEQSIVFQNRRGYSPYLICEDCDKAVECKRCSVSLTYHMYSNTLNCHYCNYKQSIPANCESCGSVKITNVGSGTEKLEEELSIHFPEANIQRMDLDTTQAKNSHTKIIQAFSEGEIDILVGTQMISKGLDFEKVNLVGVLDADRSLHFPDFRSYERTYQIVTQVAGRAGRRETKGRVIIQASDPSHPVFEKIKTSDFQSLYEEELKERQLFHYPPFVRIIKIIIKNPDKFLAQNIAIRLSNLLTANLGKERVLGANEPLVNKIKNEYIMEIILKIERSGVNLSGIKKMIYKTSLEIYKNNDFRKTKIYFDVDPY